MLCKDRVFERFRSLYTQRPAQSSVLRRNLDFNAEVAVSGKSTPTFMQFLPLVTAAVVGVVPVLLPVLELPQAASSRENTRMPAIMVNIPRL